jgi:hypothetical protein
MAQKTIQSQGLSRRSFLVAMGSAFLGTFVMPAPADAPEDLPTAPPEDPAQTLTGGSRGDPPPLTGQLRRVVGRPVKSQNGKTLAWMETFESDGAVHVMVWTPETPAEWAEANRFFEAARWRSWKTREELHAILGAPGPWLIRYNLNETYNFITSTDESFLFGPGEDNRIFTNDPAEGVRVSSEVALDLIPKLMNAYGNWDDGAIYLEPVRPEEALKNLRESRLLRRA